VLAPLRFLWNATRGYRLTPWRSPYLRWRLETYTGHKAETITSAEFFSLCWEMRLEFLRYLFWTGQLEKEARKHL
jgi:hypothetical protein